MSIRHVVGLCAIWGMMHVTPAVAISLEERCEIVGEVAGAIMYSRQNGADKAAVIEKVQVEGEPDITELFELIVQEAYGEGIEDIGRRRTTLISEFARYWQTTCFQEVSAL